ncbi:MAG: T9SS type B sorting domain-containing protein, partial [Bacteroidetes bacterium]|nr:T9SS type B sorting domain-containing protein [Bacteroidota bacterium]
DLEFSIDGGINWHAENIFDQLTEGEYSVWIRNTQTSCISEYASNPVFIYAPEPPTLGSVELKKPNHCSTMDGEITILTEEATGLEFSIDNGNVWQIENTFSGLSSGQYDIFIRRIGSDCITAYDGNPLVISCNETIDVTISAEATTVCLENVLPEMIEVDEINDCQMGNSSTVEAVLAEENCVLFTPAEGFSGFTTSPICVLNCHESETEWCDTIYFTLQVLQPKECDPLFSANILDVEMAGEEVEVCLSVPLLNFINYEKIMDGEPFQEAVSGCQMDTSYFYTYAHLVGGGNEGPYDLTSWQVEHNVFTTTFGSISELVDSMKIWDAEGNWVHDPLTMTIRGGVEGRQYSDMNITHVGSDVSSSLSTNFFVVVNGTNILLSEYGLHEFILNDTIEGCSDTILINVTNPTTPQIDTLDLLTAFETAKMDICPEGVGQLDICDQPQNGSLTADGNCVIYIPSTGFVGMDEFCLILCDDNIPQLCDTTIYFMQVLPPLDTMNISIFANTSSVFCLSEDVLQLPGNISEYSICAVNPDEVTVTLQEDGCGILLPTDGFSGLTEVCVAYCDDSDPVFCDITSLQVTVEGIDCEESIFEQDSLILPALLGNMAYVCIPLSPIEIFLLDYEVVFDGENYEGAYSNCDMDSLFVYTYASLPGLGTVGPYSIDSWEANGNTFSGQAENITAILDSLNSWDPAGNWELDVLTFTIRGGDSHSAYGDLIITQLSSGLTSTLVSNFTNIANGTEFTFIGEGYHSLYIKNNLTGCSDELIIEIQDVSIQPDTLYFQTQQGQAFTACVDTSVLSGNILSLSTPCASPNSAVEAIDLECVNYTPNPEFLGVDVVCVVICDDSLMCDTTVLVVTVEENCPDIIEEEAVVIETTDCESGTDFCLPVSITDISQYQIFVDGEAYSGDVTGCLNDTAIAYTYFLIPDGGSSGPYMLDSWVVNGITYSFPFENLETLVDSMNIWDPGAGWTISTSLQNIMGGNPASQYGMMTITQESSAIEAILEPNLTLTPHGLSINLSEGMRQVVIEETGTACRDTIKVEVQCIEVNCDLFSENEFSIETASCDSLAVFCMEFDMESLLSYNITDNGQPYEKDLFNCNIDSLFRYMYMAIPGEGQNGPYNLQSWSINDQTFSGTFEEVNALVDSMNVWDTAGNWTLEPSTFTISGGWAGNIYGVMEIIQIFTGANAILNPNQIIMPNGIGMEMNTGYHELIFTHTQYSDCSDTLNIQVNCPSATEDIQLDTTFFIGEPVTLCLEDYGFPMDGIMSAESVCDDQFNDLISFVLGFDYCVDIVPLNEGQDTFCLELCYESGDCVTFSLHATILPPCDQLFEEKYFGMGIDCESTEEFGICLPVTLPELADYKLSINGDIYTEEIVGCDYDSTLAYSYFAMPSQGTSGPYTVESWTIDGEEVGGVFENVSTLVDSMNIWDPTANWVLNTTSLTITGGNPSIDYGTLNIIQNFTGAQASLEVNSNLLPKGVWIEVVPATYTMMFTQQITGCTDTLIATLACLQTESLMDTVLVGQTDTLCLDTDELNGEIVNVENICEESSGEIVLFTLLAGTTCVEYEGMEPGTEQFCVEICDNLGICDTTYLTVLVEEDPLMANAPVAIPDTARVLLDGTLVLNLLGNDDIPSNILDTFYILTPPQHGTAIFNSDGTLSFIPETGYCNDDQPDTLEYVICNSSGCDTASASITIMCSEPEQEFEIFSGLSPNGDGINDTFVINNIESFPGNKLQIFNRWGTLIFQKEDYDNSWAGKWESDDVPDGTYFYLLKDGKGNTFSGYLHILR